MLRRWTVVAAALLLLGMGLITGCLLQDTLSPTSLDPIPVFDRQAFIARVQERCAPIEALLAETGDTLDYENLKFFSGTNLTGADETVVSVFLTLDSPSTLLAMQSEEEAPLASIAPLPFAVLLPLDPCTAFSVLENGVPYLYRVVSYDEAELVTADGVYARSSTAFSWDRANPNPEKEWHKYIGNYVFHMFWCATVSTNQN